LKPNSNWTGLCALFYRLFGATGYCSACSKMIPAFEMVMKAKGNVYHLECFACQQCNHRSRLVDQFLPELPSVTNN